MKKTGSSGDRFSSGESAPLPPDAAHITGSKLPSRGCLVACGFIAVVITYLLASPCSIVVISAHARDIGYLRRMQMAILRYADEHEDQLPPTLWALVPKYLSERDFTTIRYCDPKKGEKFDWLYFPKMTYGGIPDGTILLASPGFEVRGGETQWRFVWGKQPLHDQISEADFQRLIRGQNPPPSSPSPDR